MLEWKATFVIAVVEMTGDAGRWKDVTAAALGM